MSDVCRVMPGAIYEEPSQSNFKNCMERLAHIEQILGQNTDTWNLREHAATQSWGGYLALKTFTADGLQTMIDKTIILDGPADLIYMASGFLDTEFKVQRVEVFVYRDAVSKASNVAFAPNLADTRPAYSLVNREENVPAGSYHIYLKGNSYAGSTYNHDVKYNNLVILALYR